MNSQNTLDANIQNHEKKVLGQIEQQDLET